MMSNFQFLERNIYVDDVVRSKIGDILVKKNIAYGSFEQADLYGIDASTWYYDDDLFYKFVSQLKSLNINYLYVFDAPFRYEKPVFIDSDCFLNKLIERCLLIHKEMRYTTLISPSITFLNSEDEKLYRSFFYRYSTIFDVISVDCSGPLSDIDLGGITSFLNSVLKISNKEVWVHFSVPAYDGSVEKNSFGNSYTPPTQGLSKIKVDWIINTFTSLCKNVKFFYYGLGRDAYNMENPNQIFWSKKLPVNIERYDTSWNWYHFLGLIDCNGKIKSELMEQLLDRKKSLNSYTQVVDR